MLWTLFTLSIQTVFSKRGWTCKSSMGSHGALCHLCLLWSQLLCWEWLLHPSGPWFILSFWFWLPLKSLPLSLTSTPQCHRPQLESWGAMFSLVVTLALWPLSSSLPQSQGWCGDLPAQFSSKLLSALISHPSWMGLLNQTQCFLPCDREAPSFWSTYQRTGGPPLETRLWLQLSGILARLPGVCWWANMLPTHQTVGVDCLLHLPMLLLPVHNSVFCLWG